MKLLILGAGGHGKVVMEAAQLMGQWEAIGFLDDRQELKEVLGCPVLGGLEDYTKCVEDYQQAIVAIGHNPTRLMWQERLLQAGYESPVIIHPRGYVSPTSQIGKGSVVLANAVVNTECIIGKDCIINCNVTIDHDNWLGDGVHVSVGATVKSMCHIGNLVNIGARALVRRSTRIEEGFSLEDGGIL